MKTHIREEPKIVAAAEKQMQAWSRIGQIGDRMLAFHAADPSAVRLGPYLAVSREAGAGGSYVAELVGQRLGWPVLGKALLDRVSQRYRLSRSMLELVDETESNWAHDVLGTWFDPQVVPHEKYVTHLRHVVLSAAQAGGVVFVGRGAQFFLPRSRGLAVRIVASEPYRVRNVAERRGLDERTARRVVRQLDAGRRSFIARHFHQDVNDPHLYDLVVNVEHVGPQRTAETIVQLIEACAANRE